MRHGVRMGFDFVEQPHRFHIGDDAFARLKPVKAAIFFRRALVELRMRVKNIEQRQFVTFADFKILEIMCGRDFKRTSAFFRVGNFIGDDRDQHITNGMPDLFPDQVAMPFVVGMHGHSHIARQCVGARGSDDDKLIRTVDRIFEMPHMAFDFALLNFKIRHRRQQSRIPVDEAVVFVNQALAIQGYEFARHRGAEPLIHRKTFARPVAGRAEAAQLPRDRAAALRLPLPDFFQKRFAAHFAAAFVLTAFRQLPLNHHLRRDTGMIGSRLPQHVPAAHALITHQYILQGESQRVAHMQAAGDVGRRHHDGEGGFRRIHVAGKGARLFPTFIKPRLGRGGIVIFLD